jgi:gliding motility-associated lipoprotein GldD
MKHRNAAVYFKNVLAGAAFVVLFMLMQSCHNEPNMPRPRGYLRIDLPQHEYRLFDSTFPFRFEYAANARISFDDYTKEGRYWLNIEYPAWKGKIRLSYKDVKKTSLARLIEDAHAMVYKHIPKATGIRESTVEIPAKHVYGMAYDIEGNDVASPFQFYLTDSTRNFLRGALYFYLRPNNDSLQPVIDFIIDDIDHLMATLEWDNHR